MVSRRVDNTPPRKRRPPASTPDGRENQLSSLAYDLAEQQLRDGSASSQVITHFLKASSSRDQLEKARLEGEIALQAKKIEAMESAQRVEALYAEAIGAMRRYAGQPPLELPDSEEEFYD